MRFLDYLKEDYVGLGKTYYGEFPIFKNPSAKELRELDPYGDSGVRFIVDEKKKNIYCFDGCALHDEAYDALNLSWRDKGVWDGVGHYSRGKIKAINISASDIKSSPWLARYLIPDEVNEDFVKYMNPTWRVGSDTFPIFKNPTPKELRELDPGGGSIRFIVDEKKKDIYCFDGEMLHQDAYDTLKLKWGDLRYWDGVGFYKKGKIRAILITADDIKKRPWLSPYLVPNIVNEEFAGYVKPDWVRGTITDLWKAARSGKSVPVFLNPTRKEISEIESGNARCIINFDTKQIWVWDADKALHDDVARELKLGSYYGGERALWSYNEGPLSNGKMEHIAVYYSPRREKEPNINWLKPYFINVKVYKLK